MYHKLLATLPAILATTAFAQPIYFTANDLRTASPAATAGTKIQAADYPADLNQPIYFIANRLRTGSAQVGKASSAGAKVADAAAGPGSDKQAPAN